MFPLYFRAVRHLSSQQVLAHRIVWSFVLLTAVLAVWGRVGGVLGRLREGRTWRALAPATALIAANWFLFIHANVNGRVLEASLGYFINPLVSVLLGAVFLGERLRPLQILSVAIASAGVAFMAWEVGGLPWLSLALAFSFGLYGLVRKRSPLDAVTGLSLEVLLLTPAALAGVMLLGSPTAGAYDPGPLATAGLLVLSGPVTVLPLWWFAEAARRLPLATVGFMQYIAPTMQFLIAVRLFGETFDRPRVVVFCAVWVAVALFALDAWRQRRGA